MTIITGIFVFLFGCGCGAAFMIIPLVLYDDWWHKRYIQLEKQMKEMEELRGRKE